MHQSKYERGRNSSRWAGQSLSWLVDSLSQRFLETISIVHGKHDRRSSKSCPEIISIIYQKEDRRISKSIRYPGAIGSRLTRAASGGSTPRTKGEHQLSRCHKPLRILAAPTILLTPRSANSSRSVQALRFLSAPSHVSMAGYKPIPRPLDASSRSQRDQISKSKCLDTCV